LFDRFEFDGTPALFDQMLAPGFISFAVARSSFYAAYVTHETHMTSLLIPGLSSEYAVVSDAHQDAINSGFSYRRTASTRSTSTQFTLSWDV